MDPSLHNGASRSDAPAGNRTRFELIFAGAALAFGLFILPALIYGVGAALFGAYGENRGFGAFYGDFFRDLVEPSGRAWAIGLGPLVLALAIRAIFLGAKPERLEDEAPPPRPSRRAPEHERVEPRVGLD